MAVKPIILQGGMTTDGFSVLGDSNTGLKCKVLTGTTAGTEGGFTNVAHGLTSSKIRQIHAVVYYAADSAVIPGHTRSAGYFFTVNFDGTNVLVGNDATNSENILSKTFYVTVWYVE